jgi:hypothetical protein
LNDGLFKTGFFKASGFFFNLTSELMKEQSDGLRRGRKPFREKDMQGGNTVKVFKLTLNHHAGSSSF